MYPADRGARGVSFVLFGAVFGRCSGRSCSGRSSPAGTSTPTRWSSRGALVGGLIVMGCSTLALAWVTGSFATGAALFGLGLGWSFSYVAATSQLGVGTLAVGAAVAATAPAAWIFLSSRRRTAPAFEPSS